MAQLYGIDEQGGGLRVNPAYLEQGQVNASYSSAAANSDSGQRRATHSISNNSAQRRQYYKERERRHTLASHTPTLQSIGQRPNTNEQKRELFMEYLQQKYPEHSDTIKMAKKPEQDSLTFANGFYDDDGTMSEMDTQATGFQRGGRTRASLPVSRTVVNKSKEKPLGLVYLNYMSETKRALMPNEVTGIDTVKALFVRAFPRKLTMAMLDSPQRKIYIRDNATEIFYELENLDEVKDRVVLKIYEPGFVEETTLNIRNSTSTPLDLNVCSDSELADIDLPDFRERSYKTMGSRPDGAGPNRFDPNAKRPNSTTPMETGNRKMHPQARANNSSPLRSPPNNEPFQRGTPERATAPVRPSSQGPFPRGRPQLLSGTTLPRQQDGRRTPTNGRSLTMPRQAERGRGQGYRPHPELAGRQEEHRIQSTVQTTNMAPGPGQDPSRHPSTERPRDPNHPDFHPPRASTPQQHANARPLGPPRGPPQHGQDPRGQPPPQGSPVKAPRGEMRTEGPPYLRQSPHPEMPGRSPSRNSNQGMRQPAPNHMQHPGPNRPHDRSAERPHDRTMERPRDRSLDRPRSTPPHQMEHRGLGPPPMKHPHPPQANVREVEARIVRQGQVSSVTAPESETSERISAMEQQIASLAGMVRSALKPGEQQPPRGQQTPQHQPQRGQQTPQHQAPRGQQTPQHQGPRGQQTPQHQPPRSQQTPQQQPQRGQHTPQHQPQRGQQTPQHQGPRGQQTPQQQQRRTPAQTPNRSKSELTGLNEEIILATQNQRTFTALDSYRDGLDSQSVTPQPLNNRELRETTLNLKHTVKDLRDQLKQIRKLQLNMVQDMNVAFRATNRRVQLALETTPAGNEHPIRSLRTRTHQDYIKYHMSRDKLDKEIRDLESAVEEMRDDVVNRHCHVNLAEVDTLAQSIGNSSKHIAEHKVAFPVLADKMKGVMQGEMEIVVNEENFIKDEPGKLDDYMKRCKKVTNTLCTLKRLASVQEHRTPVVPVFEQTSQPICREAFVETIQGISPNHKEAAKNTQAATVSRVRRRPFSTAQELHRFQMDLGKGRQSLKRTQNLDRINQRRRARLRELYQSEEHDAMTPILTPEKMAKQVKKKAPPPPPPKRTYLSQQAVASHSPTSPGTPGGSAPGPNPAPKPKLVVTSSSNSGEAVPAVPPKPAMMVPKKQQGSSYTKQTVVHRVGPKPFKTDNGKVSGSSLDELDSSVTVITTKREIIADSIPVNNGVVHQPVFSQFKVHEMAPRNFASKAKAGVSPNPQVTVVNGSSTGDTPTPKPNGESKIIDVKRPGSEKEAVFQNGGGKQPLSNGGSDVVEGQGEQVLERTEKEVKNFNAVNTNLNRKPELKTVYTKRLEETFIF